VNEFGITGRIEFFSGTLSVSRGIDGDDGFAERFQVIE
jgi:hypothetical protein